MGARLSGTIPAMASLRTLMLQRQLGSRISGTLPASRCPSPPLCYLVITPQVEQVPSPPPTFGPKGHHPPLLRSLHPPLTPPHRWPLEAFHLANNRLSGTLPDSISTTIVDLDANAFTGGLPTSYTDAVRVLKISCDAAPSATGIRVSTGGGCLSGTLPEGLGQASSLEWLELVNNDPLLS